MSVKLPAICQMDTFYDAQGVLKREVFIEAAAEAARSFEQAEMTLTSLRRLFNMLKQTEQRVKLERDETRAHGQAQQAFYEFVRQVEYQSRRRGSGNATIIPEVFHSFVLAHLDVATRSVREFVGFVEYLTSIMARMRPKK